VTEGVGVARLAAAFTFGFARGVWFGHEGFLSISKNLNTKDSKVHKGGERKEFVSHNS